MKSRGFSLVELVSVLAVVVSVGAVLGPSVGKMRGQMRGVTSEGNLHTIGLAAAMYGLDHDDRMFTFTWKANEKYFYQPSGSFRSWDSDQEAGAKQLQDILLTHTGRFTGEGQILASHNILSNRRYSHLVLADYMGGLVSDPLWADPNDANLLEWQLNPLGYLDQENNFPYMKGIPADSGYESDSVWTRLSVIQKWAFSSSYQVVPHAWQQDFGIQYRPLSYTPHLFQSTGGLVELGDRRFHEVRFPTAKVHMFEEFDRELAGEPYFAYDHARPAKLMFDGSINTSMSGMAASSVSPEDYLKRDKVVWEQIYKPFETFPLPLGGLGDQTLLNMRYRWTLGGLTGVDYPQVFMRGNGR
ncbi:MAG: hypothetical protein JJ974_12650 [Phycisphaerales bacterium]|nr:hypothetical protein [Phycisphaerales bacterium]